MDLTGGKFVASGEYTCVYLDPPVGCQPGTLVADESYDPNDKSLVSRIAPKSEKEYTNQLDVKKAISELDKKYVGLRFKDHFNVAVATCTPRFTQEDLKPKFCKVVNTETLQYPGDKPDFINFLTKRQGPDLKDLAKVPNARRLFRKAFFDLLNSTVALNSEGIIHFDMHQGNIGWTQDLTALVIFDWGESVSGYPEFLNRIESFYRELVSKYKDYSQFSFQSKILKQIVKKEVSASLLFYSERKKSSTGPLSSLQKLFYSWDTYSLLYHLTEERYPGLEDFTAKRVEKNKNLSGKVAAQLLDQLILSVQIPDAELFVQEVWNIIATTFREKPVYKKGATYVSEFNGIGLNYVTLKFSNKNLAEPEQFQSSRSRSSRSRSTVSYSPKRKPILRLRVKKAKSRSKSRSGSRSVQPKNIHVQRKRSSSSVFGSIMGSLRLRSKSKCKENQIVSKGHCKTIYKACSRKQARNPLTNRCRLKSASKSL